MHESARDIDAGERSGVLRPENLARFSAQWITPAREVHEVVDTYWTVSWRLPPTEDVQQRIVDFPAITLSIEEGDVPAPFVLTTVRPAAWSRTIRGRGSVFALRLCPAGLGVLSDLDPLDLEHEQEVSPQLDGRLHGLLESISAATTVTQRAQRADELVREALRERPLDRRQVLANAAVQALTASPRVRPGSTVAAELGTSARSLQRALRSTVGIGPHDVARRIRLQEVVRRLSAPDANGSVIAAELGYADQAHLIKEFRAVSGTTPGRYVREVHSSQDRLRGRSEPPSPPDLDA